MLDRPACDEKLPDGFVRAGWRKVQKGGIVRFQGAHRQDDALIPLRGTWVFCEIVDMWAIDCRIYPDGMDYEELRKHLRCAPSKVIAPQTLKD